MSLIDGGHVIDSALAILIALVPNPEVFVREPRAASPWVQSVDAKCGNIALQIEYGGGRPLNKVAKITVNRRKLIGPSSNQLIRDLSNERGVYRLSILCNSTGTITIRIVEGEKIKGGGVRFRSGAATLSSQTLLSYTGLEEADDETFWYR